MRLFFAAAASLALTACSAGSEEPSGTDEFNARVHRYIVENPEVIEQALIALQQRARAREQAQMEAVIAAVAAQEDMISQDPRDPVFGPADARVTIVEFFDYRCPYCSVANDWLASVAAAHPEDVRIVFKELPMLGAASQEAARAALAVWKLNPERYLNVHNALMSADGRLTSARIDEIVEAEGISAEAMRETMQSDAVSAHLSDISELADMAGIRGTPFFIINGEVIAGANVERLQASLAAALRD
ncbi:MAG: DsbA family protein [Glycocaulis sp.]